MKICEHIFNNIQIYVLETTEVTENFTLEKFNEYQTFFHMFMYFSLNSYMIENV